MTPEEKYKEFYREGRKRNMSGRQLRRWAKRKIFNWLKKNNINIKELNNEVQNNTK